MSEKKAVSSRPASNVDLDGFTPAREGGKRPGFPQTSSRALDEYAGQYLSQIQESGICDLEEEKQAAKPPVPPRGAAGPSKVSQQNLEMTMDQFDPQVQDFEADQHLRAAPTGAGYLSRLKSKIIAFGADQTVDVAEIVTTNSLLRQFAADTLHHDGLRELSRKLEKKLLKVREGAFKWSLDGRRVGELQALLEVTDLIKHQRQFMFIDAGVLARVFRPSLFFLFARHPYFSGDCASAGYKAVADFHNQLLSTFTKVYIQCPLSCHPHLDWTVLSAGDPFSRNESRLRTRRHFQKHVEAAYGFVLFDYVLLLLNQFSLAEFPTHAQAFRPHLLVKVFRLVSLGLEYGLFPVDQAAMLVRELTVAVDIVSDQYNQHKKQMAARGRKSMTLGVPEEPPVPATPAETSARKSFAKQIGKLRLYCANAVVQVLSLVNDERFVSLAEPALSSESSFHPIWDRPTLLRGLSVIVFNFLVNKFKSGVPAIDARLDNMLTAILEYFTDSEVDFCSRAMLNMSPQIAENFAQARDLEDPDALEVTTKLKLVLRLIRHTTKSEQAGAVEGAILEVCELVDAKFKAKPTQKAREQFSVALARLNMHNQLFNLINFFTGPGEEPLQLFTAVLTALSRTMLGNPVAQTTLFAEKNLEAMRTMVRVRPVQTAVMLVHVFLADGSIFWKSALARDCIFDCFSELMAAKNGGGSIQAQPGEVSVALRLFCKFRLAVHFHCEEDHPWKRPINLKYAAFLAETVCQSVLDDPTFLQKVAASDELPDEMKTPIPDLAETERYLNEAQTLSMAELDLSFRFALLRLFNAVTMTVFTEDTRARVTPSLWKALQVDLPTDRPASLVVKKALLGMADTFLISANKHCFLAPKEVAVNEHFIARNFSHPFVHELVEFFEREGRWVEALRAGDLVRQRGKQPEMSRWVHRFAVAPLLNSAQNFLDTIKNSACHTSNNSELGELAGLVKRLHLAVAPVADLLGDLKSRKDLKRIASIHEKLDGSFPVGAERANLKVVEIATVKSGKRNPSMGVLAGAEDPKHRFRASLQGAYDDLHGFIQQLREWEAPESVEEGVPRTPRSGPVRTQQSTMRGVADFMRRTATQMSALLGMDPNAARNLAMPGRTDAMEDANQRRQEYFARKEGNVIKDLFCSSAKANKLNDGVAKYFLSWLFHMHPGFTARDPSESFYLNPSHKFTLEAFVRLSGWSRQLRAAVTRLMLKPTVYAKDFAWGLENRGLAAEVLRGLITVFLQGVNFTFFAPDPALTSGVFESDFSTVSTLLSGLSYQNPEFKAFFNDKNLGVMSRLDFLAITERQSIFGELFVVTYILFHINGCWKNRAAEVTDADRRDHFPLLGDLLSMCGDMVTAATRDTFRLHVQIGHDVWKGIIFRPVGIGEEAFWSLKLEVIQFVNMLLQFLDDEVVVILDEVYDPQKLFKQMVDSVSDLYRHSVGWNGQDDQVVLSVDLRRQKKANVFSQFGVDSSFRCAIRSHSQLLSLYKSSPEFSGHKALDFGQQVYVFLKRMASKARFYSIFLSSRERRARAVARYRGWGWGCAPCEDWDREEHAIVFFVMQVTGSVEVLGGVVRKNDSTTRMLKREYFRLLPHTFFYTASMDQEFYAKAPIAGSNSKMEHLCYHSAVISLELEHNQRLTSRLGPIAVLLNGDLFTIYNHVLLLFSIALNVVMLVYLHNPTPEESPEAPQASLASQVSRVFRLHHGDHDPGNMDDVQSVLPIRAISWVIVVFSLVCLTLWGAFRARTEYLMHVERFRLSTKRVPKPSERLNIILWDCFLSNPRSSSYFFHALVTLLGLHADAVFFTLNFLTLMNVSGDIWYILHSILDQFDKILATLFLSLLVLYSYAYLVYVGFADTFLNDGSICPDFGTCFLNTILLGFIPGGGISDSLRSAPAVSNGRGFWGTFFLFVTFFILVKLILINIVNSIIVLTFNNLRAAYCARLYQEENVCYVCSDTKWQIQKDGLNFEDHVACKHSVRNYLFFLMYLRSLHFSDTNELMDFILDSCESGQYGWMPHKVHLAVGQDFRLIEAEGGGSESDPAAGGASKQHKDKDEDKLSTYDDEAEESDDEEHDDVQY